MGPGLRKDPINIPAITARLTLRRERPGDAVLYPQTGSRTFAAAYPYGLIRPHDVMLGESAVRSGTIAGIDAPAPGLISAGGPLSPGGRRVRR